MKTSTLRQLADDLNEVRQYHATACAYAARLTDQPPERDADPRMDALLDAVQRELGARAERNFRTADVRCEADRRIRRLIAEFLEVGDGDADGEAAHRAH